VLRCPYLSLVHGRQDGECGAWSRYGLSNWLVMGSVGTPLYKTAAGLTETHCWRTAIERQCRDRNEQLQVCLLQT
jgi:hypothetical protein